MSVAVSVHWSLHLSVCLNLWFISVCLFVSAFSVSYHFPCYVDQWNDKFIDFLMETIENPPDVDEEDQIADSFTHLLLAFNVHFKG